MNLLRENNIRGDVNSINADRYVKSDEDKNILCIDATSWYGHSMSQPSLNDKTEMWRSHPDLYTNKVEEILNNSHEADFGLFVEVDLRYTDNIIKKTKIFPFCLENKVFTKDKYNEYMKKT